MESLRMSTPTAETIKLNKQKILDSIDHIQKYTEDNILIRKWEGENETGQLIAEINKNKIDFLGVLNSKLQRDGLGLNKFTNGERYFGNFTKDLRDKHGIYFWPSTIDNGIKKTEIYWGCWRDNCKDNHGVYLWLSEKADITPFSDFDKADFDVYIGDIATDSYVKGVYMAKIGDKYHVYYGSFDSKGKKSGNDCFYYNADKDRVLYGKFDRDNFVSGYLSTFDGDGNSQDILKVEFNADNKIESYKQGEEIEKDVRDEMAKTMTDFRSILLNEDWFGMVYNKFKEGTETLEEKIKMGVDLYDSKEDFPTMLGLTADYNDISIYRVLQKHYGFKA